MNWQHRISHNPLRGHFKCRRRMAVKAERSEPIRVALTAISRRQCYGSGLWEKFDRDTQLDFPCLAGCITQKDNNETILQVAHSQGCIHVRNALATYKEEIRQRIQVVSLPPQRTPMRVFVDVPCITAAREILFLVSILLVEKGVRSTLKSFLEKEME